MDEDAVEFWEGETLTDIRNDTCDVRGNLPVARAHLLGERIRYRDSSSSSLEMDPDLQVDLNREEVRALEDDLKSVELRSQGRMSARSSSLKQITSNLPSSPLQTGCLFNKDGGVLEIPDTGVSLEIPIGALEKDELIQMKIIPYNFQIDSDLSFTSNLSVVVELLPSNLQLLKPAKLTLPHCSVLKEGCEWKAKICSRHHGEANQPLWRLQRDTPYVLTERNCVIKLNKLSWVKFDIDDEIVEGKRIVLYAAKDMSSSESITHIYVGYYLELPGIEQTIVNKKEISVLVRKPAIFLRQGRLPLICYFVKIQPPAWTYREENPKEISFTRVAISEGLFCTFVLNIKKGTQERPTCTCYFMAGQGSELVELHFILKTGYNWEVETFALQDHLLGERTGDSSGEETGDSSGEEVTSADEVSIHTGENIKKDEGGSPSIRAESKIGKDGGTLEIPNTGVSLKIPPGALRLDYSIQMRIIPHHSLDETVLSFASNSSVVVELLPNNVKLIKPATLTLPHCLVLKKNCKRKAKVYSSHHKEGTQPQWEEEINTQCDVTSETCVMRLYNFCWKKVEIEDQIVEAKKIVLFAAKGSKSTKNVTYLHLGYYWNLSSCQQVLNLNPVEMLQEMPAVFYKEGGLPLTVLFEKVVPPNWTYKEANIEKEISFCTVAITEGSFCTFVLLKMASDETDECACYFKAGQGSKLLDLIFPLTCEEHDQNLPVRRPLNQHHSQSYGANRLRVNPDYDNESVSASFSKRPRRMVPMPLHQFQPRSHFQDSDTYTQYPSFSITTSSTTQGHHGQRMPAEHLSTPSQSTPLQRFTAVQYPHSMNNESSFSRNEATIPSMGSATATHEELPSAIVQTKDSAVSKESLQYLSEHIGEYWKFVGRNLGVTEEQLCNIEQKVDASLKEKTYQMLRVWKMKMASAANFKVLGKALSEAGRVDLQQYLLKKYQPT